MSRSTLEARRKLAEIAHAQGGYFTSKQAKEAGYGYSHLDYHVGAGNFERAGHGLYRIASIPLSDHDDLLRATHWSRDRKGRPQAVISHDTALLHYDLSDLLPHAIHVTVPPGFRKQPPPGYAIHRALLAPGDFEESAGFRVTKPMRTLVDAAGSVSIEEFEKALSDAIDRGLVAKSEVVAAATRPDAPARLGFALRWLSTRNHP